MKWNEILLSVVFTVAVWLFWWIGYPQAAGFAEQNQLFLYTWSYLGERLSVSGGLADYLAEFITQFGTVIWLGSLLAAALPALLQILVRYTVQYWCTARHRSVPEWAYPLTFIPSLLILIAMGDIYTMLSLPVAIILSLAAGLLYLRHSSCIRAVIITPLLWWLAGPASYIFICEVLLKLLLDGEKGRKWIALPYLIYTAATVWISYRLFLDQQPVSDVLLGINYFRLPDRHPALHTCIIFLCALLPLSGVAAKRQPGGRLKSAAGVAFAQATLTLLLALMTSSGVRRAYDRDTWEIVAYDQLVRNEQWADLLDRAEKYQPKSDVGCVCVNLALFMEGRMDELCDWYQCGTRGLMEPNIRDLISNVGSYEVFWRLGFVNTALRYAFDSQESTANNRKSGRHMKKMVECNIVNGDFPVAKKYIGILKHSLFYRNWAISQEKYLYNNAEVEHDPVYGYLRYSRFPVDFLFNYLEMEQMLAILYNRNNNNIMAGSYYTAYRELAKKYPDKDNAYQTEEVSR